MAGKNYKQKIVFGMDQIHVAKVNVDGTFGELVQILGAKACECSFESSENIDWADNIIAHSEKRVIRGSGKLSVLGLTMSEKALLMGVDVQSGGVAIGSNTNAPTLALLFGQNKRDGGKILNVIYNVQFSIPGVQAVSSEENRESQIIELDFTCLPDINDQLFMYQVDTTDPTSDSTIVADWFTKVQKPKPTSVAQLYTEA